MHCLKLLSVLAHLVDVIKLVNPSHVHFESEFLLFKAHLGGVQFREAFHAILVADSLCVLLHNRACFLLPVAQVPRLDPLGAFLAIACAQNVIVLPHIAALKLQVRHLEQLN